ncbi:hypothetical protein Tco_0639464 [Tanacetum coccineum]
MTHLVILEAFQTVTSSASFTRKSTKEVSILVQVTFSWQCKSRLRWLTQLVKQKYMMLLTAESSALDPKSDVGLWAATTASSFEAEQDSGYSGIDFALFPTMISAPETSPSRITSSPSLSTFLHTLCTTALVDAAKRRRSVETAQTYTRRRRSISTGSGRVSTASSTVSTTNVSTASELGSTAGVKAKDKRKAIMQESEPPKKVKKRVQVQMSMG